MPQNPVYASSTLIDREALEAVGGFSERPEHFVVGDGDLWLRMAPRFRFAYNPSRRFYCAGFPEESLCHNPANFIRIRRGEIISLREAIARGGDLPAPLMRPPTQDA